MDKTSFLLGMMDSHLFIVIKWTQRSQMEELHSGGMPKPVYAIKWAADNASKTEGIEHEEGTFVGK